MAYIFETPVGTFNTRTEAIEAIVAVDPTHKQSQRYPSAFITVRDKNGRVVRFTETELAERKAAKLHRQAVEIAYWENY